MTAGDVGRVVWRQLTAVAPAGLVPAAWAVTLAAHAGALTEQTLLVALVVMDILLVAFAVATRSEMVGPVLGVWQRVLIVGVGSTLAGTAGLALSVAPLAGLAVYTWMVLPGTAYLRTGQAVDALGWLYLLAGVLSLLGAGLYAASSPTSGGPLALASLVVVGVGQTAGIVTAVLQNTGPAPA